MHYPVVKNHPVLFRVVAPIVVGALIGVVSALVMAFLKPVWIALFVAGAIACFPALFFKDARDYWLGLLLFVLPFNIYKVLSSERRALEVLNTVGGTWGDSTLIVQLTDLPLIVLLLLWGARRFISREPIFFPKICYLPLLFLVWGSLGAFFAPYPAITVTEVIRQTKFYLLFLYAINNINPRRLGQFIMVLLLVGLTFQGALTIYRFRTQNFAPIFGAAFGAFSASVDEETLEQVNIESTPTTDGPRRGFGTFEHPNPTAMYLVFVLPVALTLLLLSRKPFEKLLYLAIFLVGFGGLISTFSRGGMIGVLVASAVIISLAYFRRVLPRSSIIGLAMVVVLASPFAVYKLYSYLNTRPEYFDLRIEHMKTGLMMAQISPIIGTGINNSNAFRSQFTTETYDDLALPLHNYYLLLLIETGFVGFGLYFSFFVLIVIESVRRSRTQDVIVVTLSIATAGALCGIGVQVLVDFLNTDATQKLLWLYSGLIVALRKYDRGNLMTQSA
jgi:hypothetical protein